MKWLVLLAILWEGFELESPYGRYQPPKKKSHEWLVPDEEYLEWKRKEERVPPVQRVKGGILYHRYMRGLGWYYYFERTKGRPRRF